MIYKSSRTLRFFGRFILAFGMNKTKKKKKKEEKHNLGSFIIWIFENIPVIHGLFEKELFSCDKRMSIDLASWIPEVIWLTSPDNRADADAFGSYAVSCSNQHTTAHPINRVTFSVHFKSSMGWCNTGSTYTYMKRAPDPIQIPQYYFLFSREKFYRQYTSTFVRIRFSTLARQCIV